uniref:Helicase, POLQ like n=1 Tax=Gallus gallus TaxID=9031 RepID=A0A8V0XH59_CHICK
MAEPALAVRRRSRISSARKRSHPPAQPGATSSPLARKRPSGGGEGTPAEPLCNNDSEEDMFGDYDSFHESDSLLAQVLDAEPQHSQEKGLDVKAAGRFAHGNLQSEMDQSKQGNLHAAGDSSVRKVDEHYGFQMNENDAGDADEDLSDSVFDELPSSQLLYLEKTRELSSRSQRSAGTERMDKWENSSLDKIQCPSSPCPDSGHKNRSTKSSKGSVCDSCKSVSLKDHLKNALTGNAKAQTPKVSKTKQLKEAILSEEISVARETIGSSSFDIGPFYGLPSKVKHLLRQFRGIETLYGLGFIKLWDRIRFPG